VDHVVVPGGNLGNSSALGKGFKELQAIGLIDRLPRLTVVQAEGAAPFAQYFSESAGSLDSTNELTPVEHPKSLATAIKIGAPVSWKKSLRAVKWTNGTVLTVSEQEIADAKAIIGRDGLGCEPASATTVAGIKRLISSAFIDPAEDVVAVLTGHVLKDTDYAINYHQGELYIENENGERRKLAGSYTNAPARVDPTKVAILEYLRRER